MTMRSACDLTTNEQNRAAGRWLCRGGLRATRQRLALARLLVGDGNNRHVTAESLFEAAAQSGQKVSLATVYNTLRSFTQAGLMAEITVDGTRSYFDTDISDHAHFYWEDESRLSDAPHGSVRFDRLPDAPAGAEISKVDVVIRLRKA
jgi:Fur family iron response transcriptional regulator